MADVVEYILKLKDDMSAGLKQVQAQTESLNKSIETSTNVVGGLKTAFIQFFAAQKILQFGVDSVKAYNESNLAAKQLEATIKSTNGALGISQEALSEQAKALQKMTLYDDDAILSMDSVLATFTAIKGTIFKDAVPAILDLSAKMGQDLKSSAVQVGKALNDPINGITALRKVGVSFSDSQEEVIKNLFNTGKVAEAQRLILAELNKEFGGSAKAAYEAADPLTKLKNRMNDIMENIGGGIVKLMDAVSPAIQKVMTFMENIGGGIVKLMDAVSSAIQKVMTFIENLFNNATLNDAIIRIGTSIFKLFTFIGNIVERYYSKFGGMFTILEKVVTFIANIFEVIESSIEFIYNSVEPLINIISDIFGEVFGFIIQHLPFIEGVLKAVGNTLAVIGKVATFVLVPVFKLIKVIIESILYVLDKTISITENVMNKMGLISNRFPSTITKAGAKLGGAENIMNKKSLEVNPMNVGGSANGSSGNSLNAGSVSSTKPTIINITMGSLVDKFTISTSNLQESSAKIREEVLKALLSAVNDSQIIATT
jgi:hypothetical protein